MANQTVSSDINMTSVISNGLANGENITINSGAILTVDQSPTVLIGQVVINEGEFFFDGENAINPIVVAGEETEEINVNGAGTLRSSLGWWEFPTLGDGTANQTFDCSTYFSSSGSGITSDVFSGVWVETGRRINYNSGTGIAPQVGDWVFKTSDASVHGRIVEVSGDGVSGYLVVRFLTGTLASSDQIELHTIQDNKGPDYQKSWFGTCTSSDVLEPGVFQEFGNCYQNSVDYLTSMGSGMAGFAFSQAYQSNTLSFGDGTNGFVVPNGARVRVPMVHFVTSTTTAFPLGNSVWSALANDAYAIETQNGGDFFLSGVSMGSAYFEDNLGGVFQAEYCAANLNFGIYGALDRASYDHCIFVSSIVQDNRSAARSVPPVTDMVAGADVRDCLGVAMNDAGETSQFGGQTSSNVNIERCIQLGNGAANEAEFLRIANFTVYDFVVIGTSFVLNGALNGDVKLLKTQIALDSTAVVLDQVIITGSSRNVTITGWEILNNSGPDDSKVVITDSSEIFVRGFHFIDDKYDNESQTIQGEEFASVSGFCSDITFSRCWQNRGSPNEFVILAAGTTKNLTVLNCSAEYSGELEPNAINTSFRGIHGGSGSLGTTTGLETDYPGTNGAHFGDCFESNTKGYIFYRNVPGNTDYPVTVTSGSPTFTKDGDVDVALGDQWEVDMGYVAFGHTSFSGVISTTRNATTADEGVDNWTAVDIDFQYDTGSGYNGTWLDLRTPSNLTSITGMVDGIRLKLRFTATTSQTNGEAIAIHTTTTLADQAANLHPIDQTIATLTLSGLVPDTEVRIYASGVEITGIESVVGTTFSYTYTHSGVDVPLIIVIHSLEQLNQRIEGVSLTDSNQTIPIQQIQDRQYENP